MKKIFLVLGLFSWAGLTQAQDRAFKPFKVDLAVGYAIPSGPGSKGGIVGSIEPKYALMDQFSVGLRLEAAGVIKGLERTGSSTPVTSVSGSVSGIRSYVLTGEYYFGTNKSRVFAGIGAGLFQYDATSGSVTTTTSGSTTTTTTDNVDIASYNKFGVVPRIGAELGHFRVGVEYNFVPKYEANNTSLTNSYLSFKIGAFIGGGQY
jgi:outer membrane protein X